MTSIGPPCGVKHRPPETVSTVSCTFASRRATPDGTTTEIQKGAKPQPRVLGDITITRVLDDTAESPLEYGGTDPSRFFQVIYLVGRPGASQSSRNMPVSTRNTEGRCDDSWT